AARLARGPDARRDQRRLDALPARLRQYRREAEFRPAVLAIERRGPDRLVALERHEVAAPRLSHERGRPAGHPLGHPGHGLDDAAEIFRVLAPDLLDASGRERGRHRIRLTRELDPAVVERESAARDPAGEIERTGGDRD